ncbi:hypothetical protein [Anaeromassilibacillus sp. An200]|uniref:hypothetical protein n=1 Tax=Anaeromassilibacillus sp. An200 TaxID=1965587 RepID=UPI000B36CD03|nr:hypothetical protein [Anaeromassilibacillus sp. An200]OUP11615.1 hypothetical protein B5F35_10135 [Anaeromassilibacillus sp. An200]
MKKACCFCGHRDTPESILLSLEQKIQYLITQEQVQQFYVGNEGNFDRMARKSLYKLQQSYPWIQIAIVLAYLPHTREELSKDTLYPEGLENVPPKYAIIYRNRWMIDHCDYLISYVTRSYGGAVRMLSYAMQKKRTIFSLC